MSLGLKHLIECHCVLPQFRDKCDVIYHKFVVFSELDDDDNLIPKHAQCNNCGVVHRIVDIGRSEISAGRDTSMAVVNIADIKLSMPANIIQVLETYAVDLPTWEETAWIIENQRWGSYVTLTSEQKDDVKEGKILRFISHNTVKIESYSISMLFPIR
jgi:hypothetical protein